MSASSIEAARAFVRVLWEDSAIKRGIAKTQAMLRSAAGAIGSVGKGMAAAGASILAPLTAAVFQFSAAGDKLDKMSARTGASAEALSQLTYAAGQSGTSIESVEKGLRKLNQITTEASDGSQTAADALSAIGLSAETLSGMAPEKKLQAVAEALSHISDPGERSARALDVLGKSGADMLPLLNGGAAGIANLMEQADELGLTISQEQATNAAQFGDAWDDVKSTLLAISLQIAAAVVPALTDLLKQVAPLISKVVQWVRENQGIVRGIALLGVGLTVAGTVLTVFAGIISAVATAIGLIFSPIGIIIGLVAALGVGIVQMAGGADAAIALLKDTFPGLAKSVGEVFGALKNLLASGEYSAAANMLWLGLKLAWVTGVDAINQEWLLWKKAFLDTFDSAVRIVSEKWASLQNTLSNGVVSFMSYFDSSINVEDVSAELDSMLNDQMKAIDNKYASRQQQRDAEFESNVGQVNQDLIDARNQWQAAIENANAVADRSADNPTAADAADNKFTDLIESLQAGDIATRINDTVKASSDRTAMDVRSVSGAGQLLTFFNKESEITRRQLNVLMQIQKNTAAGPSPVVNI